MGKVYITPSSIIPSDNGIIFSIMITLIAARYEFSKTLTTELFFLANVWVLTNKFFLQKLILSLFLIECFECFYWNFGSESTTLQQAWAKKEGLRAIHILKYIQLCQDTKNFHIGQVYSVEFESTEKFIFWSLPRPVLNFEFNGEDLGRSEQIGPSNISF